jgi:RimK-like ATP-grasp domain
MILVCGIPSETPVQLLIDELEIIRADFLVWNQRKFQQTQIQMQLHADGSLSGTLKYEDKIYKLEDFKSVYTRLSDWATLPEIELDPDNQELKNECEIKHMLLQYWIDNANLLAVNPTEAMMSNNSKPYQSFLARESDIGIPDTMVTTNARAAREFYKENKGRIIYKSISGTRSIVQQVKPHDLQRIRKLFYCPTQFQEFVEGENLRVHVIDDCTMATEICSTATDYRYAGSQVGESATLKYIELEAAQQNKCVEFSRHLGLFFSGIDFKRNPQGEYFCFEANPMPGYSYYEEHTSQPIAYTLAMQLDKAGRVDS